MTTKLNLLFYFYEMKYKNNSEKKAIEINLAEKAEETFHMLGENPLLDSEFCSDWLKFLLRKNNADYLYGGYMEDRYLLWKGSYLNINESIHVGIDFYLSEYRRVYCPIPCIIEDIYEDKDQNGGWGGRITVRTEYGIVVFAHLRLFEKTFDLKVGKYYEAGKPLGDIGASYENGGWFPHLHLQGLKNIDQLNGLDGYSGYKDNLIELYPNPLPLLGIKL
jgi:hypothetical protein